MDPNEIVQEVVQKSATVQDIIDGHIAGLSGYAIAEKFGIDPEKVKEIIRDAEARGAFIPKGVEQAADVVEDKVEALVEGVNPEAAVETTKKVK